MYNCSIKNNDYDRISIRTIFSAKNLVTTINHCNFCLSPTQGEMAIGIGPRELERRLMYPAWMGERCKRSKRERTWPKYRTQCFDNKCLIVFKVYSQALQPEKWKSEVEVGIVESGESFPIGWAWRNCRRSRSFECYESETRRDPSGYRSWSSSSDKLKSPRVTEPRHISQKKKKHISCPNKILCWSLASLLFPNIILSQKKIILDE